MDKIKEIQGQLLRYFKFGSTEDEAKEKVRLFAKDCEFIKIPIRQYYNELYEDSATLSQIIYFSDMGLIKYLRESVEKIKDVQKNENGMHNIDKGQFQTQYLAHLTSQCGSPVWAREQFKQLASDMEWLGCPIGENLIGVVKESSRLGRIHAMSGMNIITKLKELSNNITQQG